MLATFYPSFFGPVETPTYSAKDLERMRRVFRRLCDEYPEKTRSVEQRDMLASAIMSRYHPSLSERDLVRVALTTSH